MYNTVRYTGSATAPTCSGRDVLLCLPPSVTVVTAVAGEQVFEISARALRSRGNVLGGAYA
jgi:hypothetical protein